MNLKGQVTRNALEFKTINIEPLNTPGYGILSEYFNTAPNKEALC